MQKVGTWSSVESEGLSLNSGLIDASARGPGVCRPPCDLSRAFYLAFTDQSVRRRD